MGLVRYLWMKWWNFVASLFLVKYRRDYLLSVTSRLLCNWNGDVLIALVAEGMLSAKHSLIVAWLDHLIEAERVHRYWLRACTTSTLGWNFRFRCRCSRSFDYHDEID